MAFYTKQFTKPYPDGYLDKPVMTTPVTAEILNLMDTVLAALEDFLTSDEVGFKNALTVGLREGDVGAYSIAEGYHVTASGNYSHAEGMVARATGAQSHAEGGNTQASDSFAHAEGNGATASGVYSHAEGGSTKATNTSAHAEGSGTTASGDSSHAEGYGTTASGAYSHAEGSYTTASGPGSHAEGANGTEASGGFSHAEGNKTTASGYYSHTEGGSTKATNTSAHAEGSGTTASGDCSHAEGLYTIAAGVYQHVQGEYNVEDAENIYAHIVGGGTSDNKRKNIHTLDWQGNAVFAGDVTNGNGVSLDGLMTLIGTTGQLRTIVTDLPEEDISTETIYMVLKESGSENDIYNEYINVDGTADGWEFIGNSAVDLTNYYTQAQVDELLAGYVKSVSGMGLSSNDYTAEDQALVESIRTMTTADALAILDQEVA